MMDTERRYTISPSIFENSNHSGIMMHCRYEYRMQTFGYFYFVCLHDLWTPAVIYHAKVTGAFEQAVWLEY